MATLAHPLDQISLGKIVQIREGLLEAARGGARVYRFESGDPNFSVPGHALAALEAAARAGKTHYIPNNGIPELRAALAEKVRRKNGIEGVRAEDVFVTSGAMHALYVTFAALLSPGDQVIVPDPMWTEVIENIRLAGGEPVRVELREEEGYAYTPEAIAAALTPATTAIFLNTPHNPTGAMLPEASLRAIVDIARARGLWVVADEAYEDVVYAPARHVSIASLAPEYAERIVSIYSFSKSHAMSGLRTGYLVARAAVLHDRVPKLLRCTVNGVNSLAQWAALAAVEGHQGHLEEMQREYRERRDLLVGALSSIEGVRPFTPQGAFFVWA
ncbi:MAG: aminotransferase class I/II-fold pyridoxal phosphate-dependent enzyme, partial [Gemmatimonadota bacterium]|nr:aminotransferase class I/II-fold pyridoxal phosphate-dependent enzyme [Gemmatimonadota bacterium]